MFQLLFYLTVQNMYVSPQYLANITQTKSTKKAIYIFEIHSQTKKMMYGKLFCAFLYAYFGLSCATNYG